MEKRLFEHLRNRHAAEEMREVFAHVQELQEREAALIRVSWVRAKEVPLLRRERREDPQMRALAYYVAAVCEQERQHMPLIGPSVDRRTLTLVCRLARSATLRALVCFTCAQVFTSVKAWERMYGSAAGRWCLEAGDSKAQIRMCKVQDTLLKLRAKDSAAFMRICCLGEFRTRYGSAEGPGANPFANALDLAPGSTEW